MYADCYYLIIFHLNIFLFVLFFCSQKDIANLKNEIEKRQKETSSESNENGEKNISNDLAIDAPSNNPQPVQS